MIEARKGTGNVDRAWLVSKVDPKGGTPGAVKAPRAKARRRVEPRETWLDIGERADAGKSNEITTRERRVGQGNRRSRWFRSWRRFETGGRKHPELHGFKKRRKKRDFRRNGDLHQERQRCFRKTSFARLGARSLLVIFALMVAAAERSEVGTTLTNPLHVVMDIETRQGERLTQGHLPTCCHKAKKERKK
jgi:hypothetical protein